MTNRTIEDVAEELCVKRGKLLDFCRWPPDAFALTSVLLGDSGAYRLVVNPPEGKEWPPRDPEGWSELVIDEGDKWRQWYGGGIPSELLTELISALENSLPLTVSELNDEAYWGICTAILELHAIADAACEGLGIRPGSEEAKEKIGFHYQAFLNLHKSGSLSHIDPSRIRVLPKLRTPQVGISLRSISHHLSVSRASEVSVEWVWQLVPRLPNKRTLNILILPWPLEIEPCSFKETDLPLKNMDRERFGFFKYAPEPPFDIKYAIDAMNAAKAKVGTIHAVVLPECALIDSEREHLEVVLKSMKVAFFVTGVRGFQSNFAYLGLLSGGKYHSHIQHKHHRWLIDKSQIHTYHLGSALHPAKKYWEAIAVPERAVNFVCFNNWLTMCHLICEDLARHDPVSQVVRAVGPNLVIALLLDGPQLGSRWPGRYASVLADDPGSSVLTVTSLGMAMRSRPDGKPKSRVIALWKDTTGVREITQEENKTATILSLCGDFDTEWTADGRTDQEAASQLVLAGIEYV